MLTKLRDFWNISNQMHSVRAALRGRGGSSWLTQRWRWRRPARPPPTHPLPCSERSAHRLRHVSSSLLAADHH